MNPNPFSDASGDDDVIATINTTPLVDVMLVLLIIFLITIPVVTHSVTVNLPKEHSAAHESRSENIVLSVDLQGQIYWHDLPVDGNDDLLERLVTIARTNPQPEVHIRGDLNARYDAVGRIVDACRRAGIAKVGFITETPQGKQPWD